MQIEWSMKHGKLEETCSKLDYKNYEIDVVIDDSNAFFLEYLLSSWQWRLMAVASENRP